MNLVNLTNTPPSTEALIHIYPSRIVLNSHASRLLLLEEGSRIKVSYDKDRAPDLGRRVYIGKVADGGYRVGAKGNGFRVSSVALSKALADSLQGVGTYKISAVDYEIDYYGGKHYNIFFRKYDSKVGTGRP